MGLGDLFPYYPYLPVETEFDNLAWLALAQVVLTGTHDVVNALLYLVRYLVEACRRRLAADVGTGAHDSLLITEAKLVADVLFRYTKPDAAVLCNKAGSKACSPVENERERLVGKLNQIPGNIRHLPQVTLHPVGTVHKAYHRLAVLSLLQLEDALYRLLVARITANAPYRVRRVKDESALP